MRDVSKPGGRKLGTAAAAAAAAAGSGRSWARKCATVGGIGTALTLLQAPKEAKAAQTGAVPHAGVPGTVFERTFIMVKPDGVSRQLVGDIIKRWERRGFQLVAVKVIIPTKKMAETHYADLKDKPFFPRLCEFLSGNGPVVAMCWQGLDVIRVSRKMIGDTNPATSAPGTVRADMAVHIGRNVIHGSDGVEGAAKELALWFSPGEMVKVDSLNIPHLYDTSQAKGLN